jgi:rsbT co-antagonist protein RsbR
LSVLHTLLLRSEAELSAEWQKELESGAARPDLINPSELRTQCAEFLRLLRQATAGGQVTDGETSEWRALRDMLSGLSRSRALQGFTPRETAAFIFSFKKPLFSRLRSELSADPGRLADEMWTATELLDGLATWTMEVYQRSREDVINRQQAELLELSTPVVKLWDGILALPLIGTLDSARTQTVMESLLQEIVRTGAELAIIDITGVPTVDTLTAQHLLKTVTAARLMGADCIISGIRPQIAQTIVHLGVELGDVTTRASLASALKVGLQRAGLAVMRAAPGSRE